MSIYLNISKRILIHALFDIVDFLITIKSDSDQINKKIIFKHYNNVGLARLTSSFKVKHKIVDKTMRPIATLKMGDNDKENDITKDNNNQPSSGKMKETCFIFNTFSDQSLESLYQSFSVKQKKAGLECFVVTSFLFDLYTLAVSKFIYITVVNNLF